VTDTTAAAVDFGRAIAAEPRGDGRYAAIVHDGWSTPRGPNGGYLAALVLRALADELADPAKHPRSLTCHYLRAPANGPLDLEVRLERSGRAVSTLSARASQNGEPCLLALAAFAVDLDSATDYARLAPPDVPPAEAIEPTAYHPALPPIAAKMEARPAIGAKPFSGADEAVSGGWLRLRDDYPSDAFAVAQYADAWVPAPFVLLDGPTGAPTIDLTIHFRRALPYGDPRAPLLLQATSTTSASGYFEEDVAIWAPDGTLLAQSRQLALLRPRA